MLKLIVGLKGSGKTKTLIDLVNTKVNESTGSVVCLEKGNKLIHEVKYQARLIDTDEYGISDADAFYGFVAGILASNNDVTDLFIDSALKICKNDMDALVDFVRKVEKLITAKEINSVMTISATVDSLPEDLRALI